MPETSLNSEGSSCEFLVRTVDAESFLQEKNKKKFKIWK
jgi:hypothetical protein